MTSKPDELQALRDQILLAALDNIPFDGWTKKVFEQAASMLDMDQTVVDNSYPRGIPQLLDHMADWADRQALAHMDTLDLDAMRVRDRITVAVRARLEALEPYKDAVRRSFALLPRPSCGTKAPAAVWRSADRFWLKAGDTATDYNHYTKRGLLSGVIISTTLFWLTDNSDAHASSWTFLDRRIDNVLAVGKRLGRIKPVLDKADKVASGPLAMARKLAERASGKPTAFADDDDSGTAPGSDAVH